MRDTIYRDDAIRVASGYCHPANIPKELAKLPSAQTERKTGRWIEFPSHYAYKCSECGRVIETIDGKNNVYKHYPYCHCGAHMIEKGGE